MSNTNSELRLKLAKKPSPYICITSCFLYLCGILKRIGMPSILSIRSALKTSDQVQGQGAGRSRKRSIHVYVSIYRRSATQPLGLLSPLNNLSIRCEIPLHKAGRWGFDTTSKDHSEDYRSHSKVPNPYRVWEPFLK